MQIHRTDHDQAGLPDLSTLDPADDLDQVQGRRAQELLGSIVASRRTPSTTDRSSAVGYTRSVVDQRSPHFGTRRIVVGGTAAAAVVAALVVPAMLGDSSSAAFGSYSPVPVAARLAVAAEQQAECLAAGTDPDGPTAAATTERRGDFLFTLVATDSAYGNCFVLDSASTADAGQETGAISWGAIGDLGTPAPDGVSASWGGTFRTAAGASYTSASGRMGADVAAVRIAPGGQESVQASTTGGYFTAWWPGEADRDLTVLLTLRDGRTARQELVR